MNKLTNISSIGVRLGIAALTLTGVACGGGGKSTGGTQTPMEFVATEADFKDFATWTVTDYALGPSNMSLGGAHQAGNQEFARLVFENDLAQTRMNGDYPMGSILLKETFTTLMGDKVHADMGGVLAMVKRGGDFNPDHGGWEWFMLSPDGDIAARGDNLMDGACNACHSKGADDKGIDYTFNKPSEFIADDANFSDYQSWTLIESASGDSPANGSAHSPSATRKTYKKQASASPYFESGEYPVGTTIVKEIVNADQSLGTVYAMVKRGGDFSPSSNGWEWFFLDKNDASINQRSSSSNMGFCTGCHEKAGDEALVNTHSSYRGRDLVFYKKDDPVPLP